MEDGDVSKETVPPLTSSIKKRTQKCRREIPNQYFQGSSLYILRHLPHPSADDNANNKTKTPWNKQACHPPLKKQSPSTQKTSGTSPS
ncbi:uncharacterized protein CDAR_127921 [Caerostris darwini]|uniref:Uncharacterized protein n=1 Tax=Caerostris darwini TaxID=1538125 RepID=A0AAV4TXH7_9ARAC|nr:uncharacterized protein CDAR_127921 [Caerostris darwini]